MGRKKKNEIVVDTTAVMEEKNMVRDRIGESVDLNKCPDCTAHTGCFGNIDGKCTALKCTICGDQGCTFYKPLEVALAEDKAAFKRLVENQRYDLIQKYGKQLSALGAMDDEIMGESNAELDVYAEADYQKQLAELSAEVEEVEEVEQVTP